MMARCLLALFLPTLAAAGGLVWQKGSPMPIPVGGHAAALVGDVVISAGGTTWQEGKKRWLREVFAYDLTRGSWRDVGRLPEPIGDCAGIGAGHALCVIGGSDGKQASRRCYRLRLRGEGLAVDALPDLPEPRVYAAGARIGHRLYVAGGGSDPNRLETATATLFSLDLEHPAQGWATLKPLPGPARVVHTAVASRGLLYVFGGCRLDGKGVVRNLRDAWRYDPSADCWERVPDAAQANRGWAALDDGAGGIWLFGGFTATEEECAGRGDAFGFTRQVLRYDTSAGTYSEAGSLPKPNACAVPLRGGREVSLWGGEPVKKQRADWVLSADL
jgi:N-acetylneuraminic acid mutarotase